MVVQGSEYLALLLSCLHVPSSRQAVEEEIRGTVRRMQGIGVIATIRKPLVTS